MYKATIYILAGLVALIAGAVSAQAPETCAAEDRVFSGNLLTPCKEPNNVDIERMEYVFEPQLATPPAPVGESVCNSYLVFHMGDEWVHPDNWDRIMIRVGREMHYVFATSGDHTIDEEAGILKVQIQSKSLSGKVHPRTLAVQGLYYDREGETPPEVRLHTLVLYEWNRGTRLERHLIGGSNDARATTVLDSDGFYDYQTNMDKCVGLLLLEYQRLENEENLRRQKVDAEAAAAVEEQASLNNIALQKEVLRVEAEIHELRTAVAARINDNVAELALIRERTIQAAIEADRTITALQIEAKRREYESLEKTAQWLASWAQEKRDEWDDFLATAEDSWKAQIQESRETTAAALAALEERKTQVEADIAESVRLQSELRAQLTQKDADLDALRTQLDDARAALDAAEARLAEVQAAGDDE